MGLFGFQEGSGPFRPIPYTAQIMDIDIIQPASAAAVIKKPNRAPTLVAMMRYVVPIRHMNMMRTTTIPRIVGWKLTARRVDNIRDLSRIQQ
jgi:hypothetical protein